MLVSETGVNGGYCASRLLGHKEGVYTIGFPQEGEANGNGTVSPGIALPGEMPWRTITVGKTLAPIVETTVPFDVVKPLYPAKESIRMDGVHGVGLSVWMEVLIIKSNSGILIFRQQWGINLCWWMPCGINK